MNKSFQLSKHKTKSQNILNISSYLEKDNVNVW